MPTDDSTHPADAAAWRRWLQAHHAESGGVWVLWWRKGTGRPAPTYDELVTEALAFGWIDSRPRKIDDERSSLWFSPRRPGSGWSRPNKQRVARLRAESRMAPAGEAAVHAAEADGSWTLLDAVEDLVIPDDLAAAFGRHPGSAAQWDQFPPSARRGILEWIVQAKRPDTREKRVEETAQLAAQGERANQWPRR